MPIHSSIRKCIHIKLDGQPCGSPAMSKKPRCFHHEEVVRRRALLKLPFIKNAAGLQQAVMDTMRGLLERRLSHRDATALLYALQLAQTNLKTGGFKAGLEEVQRSEGSLIHHLLEDADQAQVLEAEAEIAEFEALMKEKQKMMEAGVPYPFAK